MIFNYKQYILNESNNDPFGEENWSDYNTFNDDDINILLSNGFEIENDEYSEDHRISINKAKKFINDYTIKLTKMIYAPVHNDGFSIDYIMDIYIDDIRDISFEKKTLGECLDEIENYFNNTENPVENIPL